jgi:hypothetical protein
MSQYDQLANHFVNVSSISNIEAQNLYRIRALPRRISDMELRGWKFRREMKRDLTGQKYVRYHFVSQPRDARRSA